MERTVAFYTLGCKVNQYETNAMEEMFINSGYNIVKNSQIADIYVVNTCTVTNMAERKSRQMLRRVKEINPEAILVVCGCYAQVAKEDLLNIPEIDIVLGVNDKKQIVQIVEEYIKENQKIENVSDLSKNDEFIDFGDVTYTEKNRAVIKVQDGCNMFCTYCIIPYARGRIRSRRPENVVSEVRKISKEGIKEVVITGIHVASYGKDFKDSEIGLIDLLEEINKVEGIERIRLSSLEPTLITEEFVKRLSKLAKICDHFHLSLQSGSDTVLKRMNRKYTTKQYENAVELLRSYYPEAAFTTDIIVGFPGETEKEFEETYQFAKKINFYKIHVFKYSKRRGTPAESMPNQVDGNIKEERSNRLIELSNENENKHNENYVGKEVNVLFEELDNNYYKGHTSNYMVVKVDSAFVEDKNIIDNIKKVKLISNDNQCRELIGKIVK